MSDRKWVHWAEILAAISVVVSLVLLVIEVRGNTRALERQILLDRSANVSAPFTSGPELLEAFEKIKEIDGWRPEDEAFMRRYGLAADQAVAWNMFLLHVWRGLEADYAYSGPSEDLAASIRSLFSFPDNQLFYRPGIFSAEFAEYVESVSPGASTVQARMLAEADAADPTAERDVRLALESYYDAFSDRDWARFTDHFWPGATLTTIWMPPGASAESVVATSVPAFVEQAPLGPGSKEIFEERMTSARITGHGDFAQAWAGYEARFGDPGEVIEWSGTDAFTLMRHDGE